MPESFVITVSGSRSGAGKTHFIEMLLPCVRNCAAVKVRVCAGQELSVVSEDDSSPSEEKDTGRFLAAGARRAFLISGTRRDVWTETARIIDGGEFDTVIVESNAMAARLDSDLSFFVSKPGEAKPGADVCEESADVVCRIADARRRRACRAQRNKE